MQVSVPSPSPIPVTPIPSGCGDGADGFGGVVIPCCGARPQQLTPSPCPDLGSLQAANPDPEGRGLLCSWVLCLSLHPCVIPAVTHVLLAARQYSQFPGVNPSLVTHTVSQQTAAALSALMRLDLPGSGNVSAGGEAMGRWSGDGGQGGGRGGGWGTAHCSATATLGALGIAQPISARDEGLLVHPHAWRIRRNFFPETVVVRWYGCPGGGCGGSLHLGVFQNRGCGA